MKLTREKEKELLASYNVWFSSYAAGDTSPLVELMTKNFNQIGSAEDEVFFNKADAVSFLEKTIDQLAGKTQIRNQQVRVDPMGNSFLVTDLFDIYVLDGDDWSFYSKFRSSTLMQKQDGKWKFMHQHSSIPDARTGEGDNLAIDKISEENKELREAVKRRTIELEQKTRELEIEAALERVRASAMAISRLEDLSSTGRTIYTELKALGFDSIRNTEIVINNDEKETVITYHYSEYGEDEVLEIKYKENPIVKKWAEDLKKAEDAFVPVTIPQKELESWDKYRLDLGYKSDPGMAKAKAVHYYSYSTGLGALSISTWQTLPGEMIMILERFRNVFRLAYQRYQDVAQAEAQAREARIEAALERVRSRSMGMKKSEELQEVIRIVYDQLVQLGVFVEHAGFIMDYKERDDMLIWLADEKGAPTQVTSPYFDSVYWNRFNEAKEKGSGFFTVNLTFDEKNDHYRKLFEFIPELTEDAKEFYFNCPGLAISTVLLENVCLYIENFSGTPYSEEDNETLKRFGKVFQQTYTRFHDLQKAEAQAREARIEAALERTRTQSMLMQHSSELEKISKIFHEQLLLLDIPSEFSYVWLPDEPNEKHLFWATWEEKNKKSASLKSRSIVYDLDKTEPYTKACFQAWESPDPVHLSFIEPDEVEHFFNTWSELIAGAKNLKASNFSEGIYYVEAYMKYGCFGINIRTKLNVEEQEIIRRFAVEFERTYTRFLDLRHAEEQAREAQIEASLERVRAKTMAMHNSKDVGATVVTLFEEVISLGIDKTIRLGIGILAGYERMETWSANANPKGEVHLRSGMLDMTIHPMLIGLKKAWLSGEKDYRYDYIGKDVYVYYEALNREPDYPFKADLNALPENEYHRSFFHPDGILFSFAPNPISDEAAGILARFAHVFGQTYRRYRDLLKAEEQAREAQIEAAMERVRSKAMAMHSSEDLGLTVDTFFAEITGLNVSPHRCGVGIVDRETRIVNVQAIDTHPEQDAKKIIGNLKLVGHPVLDKIFECWVNQEEYFPVLRGQEIQDYYKVMSSQVAFHEFADDEVQYGYYFYFKEGGVYAWTDEELKEQDIDIFRRYTSVLSLTYRRYLDLKDAEIKAREAQVEAALERVRARALAMQEPEELKAVADVMRQEMGLLGVEELETSSIYINDESPEKAECWYAIKDIRDDQKKLINDYFNLNLNDTWVGREMLKFYQSAAQQVSILMTGEPRIEWIRYCEKQSKPLRGYYGKEIPDRTYHLYKFSHGAIGAATAGDISEEHWHLLKRAASVFSLAYSRFRDLTQARIDLIRLKEEKKRAEDALSELKSTQAQLVHAEKMASLGELTAGIAHEIQNPLNFVNNFSEVNSELLEELVEELEKGDLEEVKALIEDMIENEEKIKQHGKRADGIVKGMLQHSRTSTGNKELVDINQLADEYLRLAYHGMRAKDKSFNADFELALDEDLVKILAIPQDIGRVLLNLINNSFYAVDKRTRGQEHGYKPKVVVSTKTSNGSVEIRVKDNGTGIPENVVNKIFQPFFTTKPTGEGTGLGLSLSYDIVTKGHGGELKVETKENESTEFIIKLPIR